MHSFKEANVSANRTPARHCAHGRGVLPFSSLRGSTESKDACVSANKVRADCLLIFILQACHVARASLAAIYTHFAASDDCLF